MKDLSSTVRIGHSIVFGVFAIIALIEAIIASAVVSDWNKNQQAPKGTRDATRFLVFCGWFAFLFTIIYMILFLTGIGGPFSSIASHAVFIFITWVFWLSGSAALSAKDGGSCQDGVKDCSAVKALQAFGWIGFVVLTAMLGVICFLAFKAFRGGRGFQDGLA